MAGAGKFWARWGAEDEAEPARIVLLFFSPLGRRWRAAPDEGKLWLAISLVMGEIPSPVSAFGRSVLSPMGRGIESTYPSTSPITAARSTLVRPGLEPVEVVASELPPIVRIPSYSQVARGA